MQIVIEIPKEMIISIEQGSFGAKYNMYDIVGCVMNGIPLPEHHGRLIDADALLQEHHDIDAYPFPSTTIKYAPTIIEADKEDADGK